MCSRLTFYVLVAVNLLFVFGCGPRPKVNLLGPPSETGQIYRSEMKLTFKPGEITITEQGVRHHGKTESIAIIIEEEKILEVKDGEVTRNHVTILSDESTETITIDGETDTNHQSNPLQGEKIEWVKTGSEWKSKLVDKFPTQAQQKELDLLQPPAQLWKFYPQEPVAVGYHWDLEISEIQHFLGIRIIIESGSWRSRFVKTIEQDGQLCAVITDEIDLQGKMNSENGQTVKIELKGSGKLVRSLTKGMNLSWEMSGTILETETIVINGHTTEIKSHGPIKISSKTELK
jgi:hypothetical protein